MTDTTIYLHYYRTIALCNAFDIDFFENIKKDSKKTHPFKLKSRKNLQNSLEPLKYKMIKEILAIENEKFGLRDTLDQIPQIFEKEKINFKKADTFLNLEFTKLKELEFITNPMVSIYESDWEWIYSEIDRPPMSHANEKLKDDYYFLFHRLGVYDDYYEANVLEHKLTIYEYSLLQEFEKPSSITEVIEKFSQTLASEILIGENALKFFLMSTVKKLIFKMHIIDTN
jgi:hypothetical protein